MQQISNHIFCDDFIADLKLETRLMPNPYHDLPYLVIDDFITPALCEAIVKSVRSDDDAEPAQLKGTLQGVVIPEKDTAIRKTAVHALPDLFMETYMECFMAHQRQIETFFNVALTTATTVQALAYETGDHYIKHSDDSSELVDDTGATVGYVQVAPLRKITTVLFATSCSDAGNPQQTFSGGELCFNYLCDAAGNMVTLRPKAGSMVIFPSNPIYAHEVRPVTRGYRLSLVQWHNAIIE